MLNTADLEQLVRDQVAKSVNDEIVGLLDSTDWLNSVEASIIEYAQQRVVAKFSNADAMAQILSTVENSVKTLFENGSISSIKELVSEESLQKTINAQLNVNVEQYVTQLFNNTEWVGYVKSQVVGTFVRNLSKELAQVDVKKEIKSQVSDLFDSFASQISFSGIDDQATNVELTVMDGAVVVENDFAATNIQAVDSIVTENATVHGDLVVHGNVNTDGHAWDNLKTDVEHTVTKRFEEVSKQSIIEDILTKAESHGINFASVTINGTSLVSGETLSPKITNTNIKRLGLLEEISVRGEADFNNTVFVANKRLGINTREPSAALSVWDEEVEVTMGKRKERTGFIGTNRKQHLEIGVNGKGNIVIHDTGLVEIPQLQVGKQRIGHGNSVPGYSGSKGDIVFNINVSSKNTVFAWMCIGGFNWVALSASIS